MTKLIYMGSDHAGYSLKEYMKPHMRNRGFTIEDLGTHSTDSCDYPLIARDLCQAVIKNNTPGILICGTGIGMSMAANRFPGIRAALCTNEFHARMARLHNDANVLCLGERVTGPGVALAIAELFMAVDFEGGRHQRRVDLITGPEAD